jgi:hypothetical protein
MDGTRHVKLVPLVKAFVTILLTQPAPAVELPSESPSSLADEGAGSR